MPAFSRSVVPPLRLPPVAGLLVREVEEGGPAARAGLRIGDVLAFRSVAALHAALRANAGRLSLEVVRGVKRISVAVELAPGDPPAARGAALHAL